MTEPFRRLALLASCGLLILGLVLLANWRSWWEALTVGLVGLGVAVALEEVTAPAPADPNRPRSRRERMKDAPWNRRNSREANDVFEAIK